MSTQPEIPEEAVLEETAAATPYLRIHARYAASSDTGHPETITIDFDPDRGDAAEEGLTQIIAETIAALRGAQRPLLEQIVFSDTEVTAEALLRIQDRVNALKEMRSADQDRAERARRYGERGLPQPVIDKVFGRTPAAPYAKGGPIVGPGAADSDLVPATLGGCTSGLPYDNGGDLMPGVMTGTAELPTNPSDENPKDGE